MYSNYKAVSKLNEELQVIKLSHLSHEESISR